MSWRAHLSAALKRTGKFMIFFVIWFLIRRGAQLSRQEETATDPVLLFFTTGGVLFTVAFLWNLWRLARRRPSDEESR